MRAGRVHEAGYNVGTIAVFSAFVHTLGDPMKTRTRVRAGGGFWGD